MPTFSGTELERALAGGELNSSPRRGLVGMVKESEEKDHVAFSVADCESWIDLPTAMIDEAETIGERGCRDHSHPVVRLRLNEPKSAEGKALLSLLQSTPEEKFVPPVGGFPSFAASARTGESLAAIDCVENCMRYMGWERWECRAACRVAGGGWLAPIARQAGQLGWGNAYCYRDCVDAGYGMLYCINYCFPVTGKLADVYPSLF